MGELGPFLVPMTLFVSMAAIFIFRGPLGKAIGERIAGGKIEGDVMAETEALQADVDELRHRLGEVEERLDFTERMLARQKDTKALPGE
jgi:hypothetical protein